MTRGSIGMPAVGGGFDYVWDLDNSCSCSGKPVRAFAFPLSHLLDSA
jgi:hypothetical protein